MRVCVCVCEVRKDACDFRMVVVLSYVPQIRLLKD